MGARQDGLSLIANIEDWGKGVEDRIAKLEETVTILNDNLFEVVQRLKVLEEKMKDGQ